MSKMAPIRIALIHALEESVEPVRSAFEQHWPQAQLANILDASLSADLASAGRLDTAMNTRFLTLGRYAASGSGANDTRAVLFTCSAFGSAIEAVKTDLSIPVMRPNEAAFEGALKHGARIALVVTFAPSLPALVRELEDMAAVRGQTIKITPILVEDALTKLKQGDGDGHDQAVLHACKKLQDQDVILLGQFSLARAAKILEMYIDCRIISTPESAVRALRQLMKTN